MADKWMDKAFGKNKGALHRMMGVPEDKAIPWGRLVVAAKQKKSKLLRARAQAALNAGRVNRK